MRGEAGKAVVPPPSHQLSAVLHPPPMPERCQGTRGPATLINCCNWDAFWSRNGRGGGKGMMRRCLLCGERGTGWVRHVNPRRDERPGFAGKTSVRDVGDGTR